MRVRFLHVLVAAGFASAAAAQSFLVGTLEISGTPPEQAEPYAWLTGGEGATNDEIVAALDGAAQREDLGALLVRLKDTSLSATHADEIGAAIRAVRRSGKRVYVFAETLGPGDLLLASHADAVLLQEGSGLSLPGVYMEEMFLADTLAMLGLKADMVQVGDYKGAGEMLGRSGPSPQWEENISGLLDSMYAWQRRTIMQGRGLDEARLDAAMKTAWMADGAEGVASGLIDATVDWASIDDLLAKESGRKVAWEELQVGAPTPRMDMANPFALLQMLTATPQRRTRGPTLAVVHVSGPIVDGDSGGGGLLGGGSVGSRTIRNVLEELERDRNVRGVVVRIDSPGGSAVASEVIWQGVRRLAAKKPVWVSVGSMAASGGYYIAVAGERVYVNPSSIVGSIGVVGGKVSLGGLYEKLKVRVVGRGRGPMAEMLSSSDAWDEQQKEVVREKMRRTYDLFARRVSEGRKGIDLDRTAEGRLFTGYDAVRLNMADRVGGLSDALSDLAAEVGLADYDVMHYPGPKNLAEMFEGMFGGLAAPGSVEMPVAAMLRASVGDAAWPAVRDAIDALGQLRREPVVLAAPRVLIFR